jgi:hypothetical protein
MTDHRFEAHATIRAGERERVIDDGSGRQLVRVVLCDGGTVVAPDGSEHRRPDVVCPLRPSQARQLAERLLALAAQAEQMVAK